MPAQSQVESTTSRFPWRVFWILLATGTIAASASIPYLSEHFFANPEVRKAMPPLPLPVLQFLVVAQTVVYLAIIVPLGLILAPRVGFEFPLLAAWVSGERPAAAGKIVALGLLSGVAVGTVALTLEMIVFFPHLPLGLQAIDAGSVALWKRLLVGVLYGGIVEELFFRLFLLSLFVWLFRQAFGGRATFHAAFWAANLLTALLFALGHLPGTSTVTPLTTFLVVRALVLNGLVGMTCGYLFWRRGLEAAMVTHMGFHLVWQMPGVWIARALIPSAIEGFLCGPTLA